MACSYVAYLGETALAAQSFQHAVVLCSNIARLMKPSSYALAVLVLYRMYMYMACLLAQRNSLSFHSHTYLPTTAK